MVLSRAGRSPRRTRSRSSHPDRRCEVSLLRDLTQRYRRPGGSADGCRNTSESPMIDRRSDKRYPIFIPISGWSEASGSFGGHTRDASGSGVYIVARVSMKENDRFVFLMSFPELLADTKSSLVWANCHAVRIERAGAFAVGQVGIGAVVDEYVMPTAPRCV